MRLFLAIPLPGPIRDEVAALTRRLALDAASWRPVEPSGLHLTLRFLGEVATERRDPQDAAWRAAVKGFAPIPLEVADCGFFATRGRARIIWVAVRDRSSAGALASLAAALERAARDAGFAPERRPFAPHVTLARAKRPAPPPRLPGEARRALGDFVADEVVLFRSLTDPTGARYLREQAYALEGT